MAAHLGARPIRLQCYLNDILIQSSSTLQAEQDLQIMVQTLQNHGFSVNWERSQRTPSTSLIYLGAVISTNTCQVFLSQEYRSSIKAMVNQVRSLKLVPLIDSFPIIRKDDLMLDDCPLGTIACMGPTMAPAYISKVRVQQFQCMYLGSSKSVSILGLVDVSSHGERLPILGTQPNSHNIGHQPFPLGCLPAIPSDSG